MFILVEGDGAFFLFFGTWMWEISLEVFASSVVEPPAPEVHHKSNDQEQRPY